MFTGELLLDLPHLSQPRVQIVASLSGTLIQADVEKQLALVDVVSDETRDENLIHFLLDRSPAHGLTLLTHLCGFHHDPIRCLESGIEIRLPTIRRITISKYGALSVEQALVIQT
jgi:hypothetical protein